jgi:multiple sugar transport system permease protein
MATAPSIAPPSEAAAVTGGRLSQKRRRQLIGLLYVAPTVLFLVVFFIAPLILVGRMSITRWPLLGSPQGVNFPDNFTVIAANSLFWPAIGFTIEYTILVTILLIGLGLALALMIDRGGKWRGFLRTSFLVPTAIGLASASVLFYGLYSPVIGPITPILQAMGHASNPIEFLGDPLSALLSTTVLVVWKFAGFYMLILLVGLQAIPGDLTEAAAIDGASSWDAFRYVTIPLLRRSLALALILCITGSLLAFDQFYILTKGGPDNSTVTVVQLIYREAFQRQNLGAAAALSVLVLIVLIVLNGGQFRALRRAEEG